MFISNQVSKFLIPTAIALVFTALAQWLTSETDRLSATTEALFSSPLTPKTSSQFSAHPTAHHPRNQLDSRENGDVDITTRSFHRYANWISYWRDHGIRWHQQIEAFWQDGELGEDWRIGSDGSVAVSPTAREIAYQRESPSDLMTKLFATPNSPGVIAVGAAEGTRTLSGGVTSQYWGHRDPANGVTNLGTFSYQHGAKDARQADSIQLARLQQQLAEIQHQAQEVGLELSPLELVAAADLANQSPEAGHSYIFNLQEAYDQGFRGIEALLEARVQSFVNPQTRDLDAAGFGNNWQKLRQDQLRRLSKLQKTLKVQGAI
jgi:hypothetical protein